MRRSIVVLVCDICGSDADVITHTVSLDGQAVEVDVCTTHWQGALEAMYPLAKVGRPVKRRPRVVIRDAVRWGETGWTFTSHALMRVGERHLDPAGVIAAAEDPEMSYPAQTPDAVMCIRGRVRVVALPDDKVILTAASRDTDYADLDADAMAGAA